MFKIILFTTSRNEITHFLENSAETFLKMYPKIKILKHNHLYLEHESFYLHFENLLFNLKYIHLAGYIKN